MKIYIFDELYKKFLYSVEYPKHAKLPSNATDVPPVDSAGNKLLDPTWNGDEWIGTSKEEYDKQYTVDDVAQENTESDVAQAQQMIAFAKLQADVDALKKGRKEDAALLATLMKQQATKAKEEN